MFFKIADKTGEIEAINWDVSSDKVEELGKNKFGSPFNSTKALLERDTTFIFLIAPFWQSMIGTLR
ncbi:unnamed protein product [marine sediment metagenome]|uniref:Uncharacterized protein n=1 Tax=marine sediment metagenome TaxID=412755 RepID=X1TSU9_9ZZZZ